MTRINLVDPKELSDQHLIREYNELPRCIKQDIDTSDAPFRYTLGTGHMKWAKKHSQFLMNRYMKLCDEMLYRGFKVNYPFVELFKYHLENTLDINCNWYDVSHEDVELSKSRLNEKYKMKPNWYRWTKRKKPDYYGFQCCECGKIVSSDNELYVYVDGSNSAITKSMSSKGYCKECYSKKWSY